MIAVDTNVLVRALLNDDPRQSPIARRFLERTRSVLVPVTVFLELAWVLKSTGWTRRQIHGALTTLATLPAIHLDRSEDVRAALEDFRQGSADLADYLALHLSRGLGARKLFTFDRKLAKTQGAELLDSAD
jgi:predicted nucleic-acid-binding protein